MTAGAHNLRELVENQRLGWSYHELQSRVGRLGEAFGEAYASLSGKRGAWLISDAGLELLVRLRELEATGASIETALATIKTELGERTEAAVPIQPAALPAHERQFLLDKASALEAQVADLRRERDRLLSLLENLLPALPPAQRMPRRRFWPFRRRP